MRGTIPGLGSPHPIGETLPAMYREVDEFAIKFTDALDEILAPVFLALDNVDAYLDPEVAPVDFLRWLATWVGVDLDETWPIGQQRDHVRHAVELYSWRGTRRGLSQTVALYAGMEPEIVDNGVSVGSDLPNQPIPGQPVPSLHVRVHVAPGRHVERGRLDDLVAMAKPAHLPHTIEVLSESGPPVPPKAARAQESSPIATTAPPTAAEVAATLVPPPAPSPPPPPGPSGEGGTAGQEGPA